MDVSGEQHIDVEHNIFKQRLNASGELIPTAPEKESECFSYIDIRSLKLF